MAWEGGAYNKTTTASSARWRLAMSGLVLGFLLLGSISLSRFLGMTQTTLPDQQRVVNSLLEVVKELRSERRSADLDFSKTTSVISDEMITLVEQLKTTLDQGQQKLMAAASSTRSPSKNSEHFAPLDKVADPGVAVLSLRNGSRYVASPSIVRLKTGRLLTVLERSITMGATLTKLVYASDDDGITWAEAATIGPMNWPQVFRCTSGVYVIGTQRHFSPNNNLVISRMLDDDGTKWSKPVKLTVGWSVVTANVGVDISFGRVTKPFEVIPAMARPLISSTLRSNVTLPFSGGPLSSSWQHPPVLELPVESVNGFVPFTLIKVQVPDEEDQTNSTHAFFFRILEVDTDRHILTVRLERFNHYWADAPVVLSAGQTVAVRSGASIYGGVDWVAMAMSADENADLTLPSSWSFSRPVGNPASIYANEMRVLFDVSFKPDSKVRESIVGAKLPGIKDNEEAYEAGFGSVYWMEGVVTRLRDRHGGNGKLLGIMRVNNDVMCDLAAVIEYDDSEFIDPSAAPWGTKLSAADNQTSSSGPQFKARFLRYTNIPGLAVAHPSIVYDEASDLYWMVSNANRDSMRQWKQPWRSTQLNPRLNIAPFSKCEVDRSTLVLYYSPNQLDWMMAGIVDYHIRFGRHFTYPHMIIDDTDLLIVSRASFTPWSNDTSDRLPPFFNNHNSNAISFHRVRNFRALANVRWANEQGVYSGPTRKSTNAVSSLVHTLMSEETADSAGIQVTTGNANTTGPAENTPSAANGGMVGGRRMLVDVVPHDTGPVI